MPVTTQFHSSMTTTNKSSVSSRGGKSPGATAAGAPSEVTEAQFARWKIELQNKLTVQQEKELMAERKKYKAHEDGKFWDRKQHLHKKTADQFGKAKMEAEAVRQANLTRGAEYKAELEEMKEMAAQQREEWMQFGHELTVQHGPEQAERTKARLAETAEAKAEMGRMVKQEAQMNNKMRHTQRTNRLEEKREMVESGKQNEFSHAEEAKNFSFHQKEEKGGEVRRTERKWKSLSKQEREAFLQHAHENHNACDLTKARAAPAPSAAPRRPPLRVPRPPIPALGSHPAARPPELRRSTCATCARRSSSGTRTRRRRSASARCRTRCGLWRRRRSGRRPTARCATRCTPRATPTRRSWR